MLIRLISAAIFLLVVLPCIYFSSTPLFIVFTIFLSASAVYEMLKCNKLDKCISLAIPMFIVALLPIAARYLDKTLYYRAVFPAIFVLSFIILSAYTYLKDKPDIGKVISAWFFSLYATAGFTSLVLLADLKEGKWHIMFFAFIAAWVTDSCALICGMLFGKHKLLPTVSPKKTIEGAIGGIVCCIAAFCLYAKLLEVFLDYTIASYWIIALCGLICGIVAVIGDLIFSAVKRASGIKDFGKLMPGHGGVLDRFDSLVSISIVLLMFITLTDIF